MDDKTKKKVMIGVITTGVIASVAGGAMLIMSGDKPEVSKTTYSTSTPNEAALAEQPGDLSIEPLAITVGKAADGSMKADINVTALFKDLTVQSVRIEGDPRLSLTSSCLQEKSILKAGQPCPATITFRADAEAPPAGANPPEIIIGGTTSTPGGAALPIEKRSAIAISDGTAPAGPLGLPAIGADGTIAGAPIDAYGPTPPLPAMPPVAGTVPPPADGTATAAPSAIPMQTADAAPAPRVLSAREQFILARRQAVLAGIPSRQAPQAQKPQGTWADLNIPTATSSYPQDMSRVVTMDRIITAVLARPYDSRASQQVVAQVDRNVYGANGRNVLIPRGSQIIGTAQGGGERVAIQWKQIIRPDGARMVIEATSGDAMGQAGVPGRTNNRLMKRYGSILLGTVFKAGTAKLSGAQEAPSEGYGQPARNTGAIVTDVVKQDIERIVQDIVQRNSSVQPIITVPAGTRITIVPTMDIQMRPMQGPVEERHTYPRRQNGGAPAPSMPGTGDDEDGYDAPQPSNRRSSPLPPAEAPALGSTPPWESN